MVCVVLETQKEKDELATSCFQMHFVTVNQVLKVSLGCAIDLAQV